MNGPYSRTRRVKADSFGKLWELVYWIALNGAKVFVIVATVVFVWWVGMQLFAKLGMPYFQYWNEETAIYIDKQQMLVSGTSFCGDTPEEQAFRAKVKTADQTCREAHRVVTSVPAWTAFARLVSDFNFCPDFICLKFKIDVLDALGIILVLMTVSTTIVMTLIVCWGCRSMYRYVASKGDLPFAGQPLYHHHHQQIAHQPATAYPPATKMYDFNRTSRIAVSDKDE
jgi:hypothetical protein